MLARRELLKTVSSASLAAVLANPVLTRAAAASTETLTLRTAGGLEVQGALALPDAAKGPAPSIILIHEWWGLNDQIRAVAADFAKLGYAALAIDLMGGSVATTPDAARAQMKAVNSSEATDTAISWIDWIRRHDATTDKVGTVGWCFGGGWSLNASIATPVDGTVVYYGNVKKPSAELASLKGPVVGHFATEDKWINREMVDGFVSSMSEAGKALTVYWYEANHAFANPTSARYDQVDAALAWERTKSFFTQTLRA